MRNICFVCNFDKTPVFIEMAKAIETKGVNVFWIVQKKSQYKELLLSFPDEKILLIDRSYSKKSEAPVGNFKINEIIYGDRIMRHEPSFAYNFLINIQRPIYRFIKNNKIGVLFGEITQSYEVLLSRMCIKCKELNCDYISTMVARIPDGRLMFFKDEKLTEIVEMQTNNNSGSILSEDYIIHPPYYLSLNDGLLAKKMSLKGLLIRVYNFISCRHIEKDDPGVTVNRFIEFKIKTKEVINQLTYRFVPRSSPEILEGKKFVLFGFHKQPESSIDICGRYYEDQFLNVINIWRNLPDDWYLVIKEHSNAIGDRSFMFFSKLLKFKNIILLNEKCSAIEIMKKAQLVITVTGTMAIEAAMQNIPAITLAEVPFNRLNYCNHFSWDELQNIDFQEYVNSTKRLELNKEEYLQFIKKNSFIGELDGILSNPNVLDPVNLKNICNALLSIL